MKSSSGEYFIALDHVRAFAALMVFSWHFVHVNSGQLAAASPLLALFAEGHTGVSLFMVLSGYLFAKLTSGRQILWKQFFANRALRLLPLLVLVLVAEGLLHRTGDPAKYLRSIARGILQPSLPNGGWSITIEFHFYALFPLLLVLTRKWKYSLLGVLLAAILLRAGVHEVRGQVQSVAYWTIFGRIDQFLLGILAWQFRDVLRPHRWRGLAGIAGVMATYAAFDRAGGFFSMPSYPSPSAWWIVLPTIEGLCYALAVSWYDGLQHRAGAFSRFVASIGTYSYAIYLLHFFVVFELARAVNRWVSLGVDAAVLASLPAFLLMVPIGYLAYHLVEKRALRFRVNYLVPRQPAGIALRELAPAAVTNESAGHTGRVPRP